MAALSLVLGRREAGLRSMSLAMVEERGWLDHFSA